MSSPTPSRREVLLLAILLIIFVFVSQREESIIPEFSIPLIPSRFNFTTLGPQTPSPQIPVHTPLPQIQTHLTWGSSPPPETTIVSHAPGWTIFDNLYILNGTVYIVSDDPQNVPKLMHIISKGIPILNGNDHVVNRRPTEKEIQVVSTAKALKLFGRGSHIIDGVSFLANDPPQYVAHYYHWSAELWFGFWRTYSSLDTKITREGHTTLSPARRLFFSHLDSSQWRDYASMSQIVLRSSFPSVQLEFKNDWEDRIAMGRPFMFERVLLADRSAAMYAYNYKRYQRTTGGAMALPGSANWWQPIRNNVVQLAGIDPEQGSSTMGRPVITYISRQEWGRRMLKPEDHARLVKALEKLCDEENYELNIVAAEKMSRLEQIRLAARTTVMMGVHGNGLTSLVWMKPTPQSTVMEFLYPQGFAHDYEFTTRALGMQYYGFWNSESFSSPGLPLPKYVDGFQGNAIPIDADAVVRLVKHRVGLNEEVDD